MHWDYFAAHQECVGAFLIYQEKRGHCKQKVDEVVGQKDVHQRVCIDDEDQSGQNQVQNEVQNLDELNLLQGADHLPVLNFVDFPNCLQMSLLNQNKSRSQNRQNHPVH